MGTERYTVSYETPNAGGGSTITAFVARGYSLHDVVSGLFGLGKPQGIPRGTTKLTITLRTP